MSTRSLSCSNEFASLGKYQGIQNALMVLGSINLALLVFAGQLKVFPGLIWIPIDLTLICTISVSIFSIISLIFYGLPDKKILIPLALWLFFLPAIAIAPGTQHSLEKIVILFSVTFVCVISPFFLMRLKIQKLWFARTIIAIGLFVAVNTLFFGDNLANEYSNRITLEGVTTIGTAQMVCAAALFCFFSVFRKNRPILRRLLSLTMTGILFFIALASGSRGPIVSSVVALLTILVFAPGLKRFRGRALLLSFGAGLLSVVMAMRQGSDGLLRIFNFVVGNSDASTEAREYLWQYSLNLIQVHPFGMGWGGFMIPGFTYPHNMILEVAVEAGLILSAVLVSVIIWTVVRGIASSASIEEISLTALLVFAVMNSMVSSDINGNRLLWIGLSTVLVMVPLRKLSSTELLRDAA